MVADGSVRVAGVDSPVGLSAADDPDLYDFVFLRVAKQNSGTSRSGGVAGYRCYVLPTAVLIDEERIASVCAVLRASLRCREGGMVVMVTRWTGLEIRALREAMRMSVRDFGEHLGVSDRMVSKWEAGGIDLCPRSENQQLLDSCLTIASPVVRQRFTGMLEAIFETLTVPVTDRPDIREPIAEAEATPTGAADEMSGDEPGPATARGLTRVQG